MLVRLEISNRPGMLGRVTSTSGKDGGSIGAVDIVGLGRDAIIRDITINAADIPMGQKIVDELKQIRESRFSMVRIERLWFVKAEKSN
jgi:malate dehydrogenase (oxaloacetate-decarboxylating)